MSERKVCVLCGREGHRSSQCPMLQAKVKEAPQPAPQRKQG